MVIEVDRAETQDEVQWFIASSSLRKRMHSGTLEMFSG